ncbi:hypothetical protein ILYODFUR_014591, partial [Ilyodon furcidens]
IRLYARPDAISSGAGDYALHITKRLLGFYEDYFRVQYSLPKLGIHWAPPAERKSCGGRMSGRLRDAQTAPPEPWLQGEAQQQMDQSKAPAHKKLMLTELQATQLLACCCLTEAVNRGDRELFLP